MPKLAGVGVLFLLLALLAAACDPGVEEAAPDEAATDPGAEAPEPDEADLEEVVGADDELEGEPVRIGTIQPMTGPYAAFGVKFHQAYGMAVEEVNAAGGIEGRPLEIVFEDSQDELDLAQTAARSLVQDEDILAIIGGRLSGAGLAIGQIAEAEEISYLVDHPSADIITQSDFEWTFRLNPASSFNTVPLQEYLTEVATDVERVTLVYENSVYGTGVAEPFRDWLDENGYDIVVDDLYEPLALDYRDLLNRVNAQEPDLLFLASNIPDSALIVRQANELGLDPSNTMISGAGAGFSINEFLQQSGDAAENIFSTGPWAGDPHEADVEAFVEEFTERFGHPPKEHEVEGYAAVEVIADALQRADSLTREDIRDALAETDLDTIFGPVRFDDFDGYQNQNDGLENGQVVLSQWQDGLLLNAWPEESSQAEGILPE